MERRRKDIYGKTRAEVQKKLRAAQSANDAGQLPTTTKTTATLLLESGIPINNVSELLGHASSVVTSRIYAHATKTGMARVTAATANLFQPIEPEPQ